MFPERVRRRLGGRPSLHLGRQPVAADRQATRLTVDHRPADSVHGVVAPESRGVRLGWEPPELDRVAAVQVVLAGSARQAAAGVGSVWDSGRRSTHRRFGSDICLHVPLGPGPGEAALDPDTDYWWSVQLFGARGEALGWSRPASLRRSAAVVPTEPPRALAVVGGSLRTADDLPAGDDSLFRWLLAQGAGAVWPLLISFDLADRMAPWLERLRVHIQPGDRKGVELYAALVEAADLSYDDWRLRAQHAPHVAALLAAAASTRETVPAMADGTAEHDVPAEDWGYADQELADPTLARLNLADLLLPLLGSTMVDAPLPVGVVVSEIAGIRSVEPGFRRFRVEPCLLPQAAQVDVDMQTVRGPVLIRLRRRPDSLAGAQVMLTVPTGAEAELVLPWSGAELRLPAGSYVFVN